MMNIVLRYFGAALATGCMFFAPGPLRAQQPSELNQLYGQGVNAYFAGRSTEAEAYLSQALALEPEDPRLYYFRALSLLRLGRLAEARGDMMIGANIEAQRPQRYAVGKSLERVQGGHRLMLEQYRRQARSETTPTSAQFIQPVQPARPNPQPISMGDENVLRRRVVIPLDRLLGPGNPQPLTAEELSQRARRARAAQASQSQPTRERSQLSPEGDDPFRDDPARLAPGESPAPSAASTQESDSTIAPEADAPEEATLEAEEMPADEEAAEAEERPEADEDPFGGDF
jgi:hypothetical protein